jgi:hypothetical protein
MRRTASLPLPLLLTALLLAGCTDPSPMPTPPSTPSQTPVFASDEEALAAAEEAYGEYLATADAILNEGGANPERLLQFVSDDVYADEKPGLERVADLGWHGTGQTTFTLTLQQYDEARVVAYSCDDVSATDLRDGSDQSVVRPGRMTRVPFEVQFDVADNMRILKKDVWDGGGIC